MCKRLLIGVLMILIGVIVIAVLMRVVPRHVPHPPPSGESSKTMASSIEAMVTSMNASDMPGVAEIFAKLDNELPPEMANPIKKEILANVVKGQILAIPLRPLYEGYRRRDPKAIAGLMAYARDETYDAWERGTAIQAIGRLGTKEALIFECSFLKDTNSTVNTAAFYGLPDPLEKALLSIYATRMTSQEFSNMLPRIEQEIDAYLASSNNPPAIQVNQ